MIKYLISTTIMAISFIAQAEDPIVLHPFDGDKELSIDKVMNIYGKCGENVIAILGVKTIIDEGSAHFFSAGPDANLLIRNGQIDKNFTDLLSDYNTVRCISTPQGEQLIVGSTCSGVICGDEFDYSAIDMKTLKVRPYNPKKLSK